MRKHYARECCVRAHFRSARRASVCVLCKRAPRTSASQDISATRFAYLTRRACRTTALPRQSPIHKPASCRLTQRHSIYLQSHRGLIRPAISAYARVRRTWASLARRLAERPCLHARGRDDGPTALTLDLNFSTGGDFEIDRLVSGNWNC